MKAKAFKIVNLILAVLVFVFALSQAFAWFAEDWERAQNFNGSSGSPYFASGNGLTAEKAFVISNKYHLYNLAWLQNTGKLTEKYYFKVELENNETELNMSGFWLPPIGTDEYPFKGIFDGNGAIITGLKVTTDTRKLTNLPSQGRSDFSQSVGMFGMTAENAEIKNFTLKEPLVEVDANATYSSTSSKTAGIAIGYANCGASNIGVYNGKLNVEKSSYTTVNSIVGGYNSEIVDGSGIDPEVGSAYGSSMDLQKLFTELGNTSSSDGKGLAAGYALPFLHNSSDSYATGVTESSKTVTIGQSIANITSGSVISGYELSGTKQVSVNYAQTKTANENNIGYFTGSDMKGYNKSVSYETFYYPKNSSESYSLPATIGDVTYNAPDSDIVNYLNEEINGTKRGSYLLRSSSSHRLDELDNANGYTIIKNGKVGSYEGEVLAPVRSIWVAPANAGTLRIVLANPETKITYVTIVKLTRSTPKNYSTYFSKAEAVIGYMNNNDSTTGWPLLSKQAYYFEIAVTQEDIDAGYEYAIVNSGNGPYFAYLDLGTSGSEGGGGGGTKPTLENIDFTYLDSNRNVVLVADNAFNATLVVIEFSDITLLYFIREDIDGKDNNNKTLEVQYNGAKPTATTGADNANIHEVTSLTFPTS